MSESASTTSGESRAIKRLVRKMTLENLWIYILTLLRDEGPLYGYEIRERISKRYNFRPGKITCYMVLYKLENEGLISSKELESKSRGAPRKYYTITRKGLAELQKAKRFLEDILRII